MLSIGGRWLALMTGGVASLSVGASASADERRMTETLVVSAERRETALLETPASLWSIGGDELQRIGADHASEILARAPGVLIHRGSGQEHLTSIRSPILTGGAGAGSFLYLEDGVPLRAAGFANVNGLFEAQTEIADSVEVTRGPSGAFYGANAIHGVIDVRSRAPGDGQNGFVEVSGDTLGRVKARGWSSARLGEGAFSLGAAVLDDPGFRADSGVDQQKIIGRYDRVSGRVSTSSRFSFVNLNQETAGFVEGPQAYRDALLRRTNPNPDAFRDVRAIRASTRIDVELGEKTQLAVTPYSRWTDMDFLLHFLPSQALEENRHWSVGAQSAIYHQPSDRVAIAAGLDGEFTKGRLSEVQSIETVFSFTQGDHYDYRVNAAALSGFANASFDLTDALSLTAAARLDWTRYNYENQLFLMKVGRFLRPDSRVDSFLTASPKVSAQYNKNGHLVFASYARGARAPQTTDLYRLQINQTESGPDPEFIDAFEVGWRGAPTPWLSGEIVGYAMEKKNFFFRDADGRNVDDGRTRHLGVETDWRARLGETLVFSANAAYGAHTYRFDRPVNTTLNALEAIRRGDDVDSAPRWLAGARGRWTPSARIGVEAAWIYVGGYFLDASNTRRYPGHSLVDLRAHVRPVRRLEAFVALRNVFNTFYADRADFAFGDERYFPGEGRVLTVGLRVMR